MEKAASLEITVISAEELRISNRPIKKNAFVTVGTDPHNYQSTTVNSDGGSYPFWNEKFQLPLPTSARSIAVQVQCKTVAGIKTVGTANVPMSDIIDGYVPAQHLHLLSYRLRERDGQRNGIINLSIKMVGVGQPVAVAQDQEKASCSYSSFSCGGSGIAIGIPVSCVSNIM